MRRFGFVVGFWLRFLWFRSLNEAEQPCHSEHESGYAYDPSNIIGGDGQQSLGLVVGASSVIVGVVVDVKRHTAREGGGNFFIPLDAVGVFNEDHWRILCISDVDDVNGRPTPFSLNGQLTDSVRKETVSTALDADTDIAICTEGTDADVPAALACNNRGRDAFQFPAVSVVRFQFKFEDTGLRVPRFDGHVHRFLCSRSKGKHLVLKVDTLAGR